MGQLRQVEILFKGLIADRQRTRELDSYFRMWSFNQQKGKKKSVDTQHILINRGYGTYYEPWEIKLDQNGFIKKKKREARCGGILL
jgi:hypothetical protein